LSDQALRLIESLGYGESAFDLVLQRLDSNYGGARRLYLSVLEDIDNFRAVKEESVGEIEKFAEQIENVVVRLKENNKEPELQDGVLLQTFEETPSTDVNEIRKMDLQPIGGEKYREVARVDTGRSEFEEGFSGNTIWSETPSKNR